MSSSSFSVHHEFDDISMESFYNDNSLPPLLSLVTPQLIPNHQHDAIDRSQWLSNALTRHPELSDVRDRIYPLERAISLSSTLGIGKASVKEALDDDILTQLILQHLQVSKLKKTKQILEEETGIEYAPLDLDSSLITHHIRSAITNADKLYDLVISNNNSNVVDPASAASSSNSDEIRSKIEQLLFQLGFDDKEEKTSSQQTATEINIWDEPSDDPTRNFISGINLSNGKEQIQAANLNKLIEKLTPAANEKDFNILKAFLMTYQSFTTPDMLLTKLIQRFHVPPPSSSASASASAQSSSSSSSSSASSPTPTSPSSPSPSSPAPASSSSSVSSSSSSSILSEAEYHSKKLSIQLRVCSVLKNWVEGYFTHFTQKLLHRLTTFLDNEVEKDGSLAKVGKSLRAVIQRKIAAGRDHNGSSGSASHSQGGEYIYMSSTPSIEPKVPRNLFSPSLTIMDVDEEEIARQLCLYNFDIYKQIQPPELLNQAWAKPKLRHRAAHVLQLSEYFNTLSMWVASLIVRPERLEVRRQRFAKMVRLAEHLRAMNNYHTLQAVLSGLCNNCVYRLTHTMDELGTGKQVMDSLNALKTLMNSANNSKLYREALRTSTPPTCPFIGVVLSDITFIEEGNPNNITVQSTGNTLTNWARRELISDVIMDLMQFQNTPYTFQKVYQIRILIEQTRERIDNEEELYQLSLKREPKNVDKSQLLL